MEKIRYPSYDEKVYVPTSLHVYRGLDDTHGGIAHIDEIHVNEFLPVDHYNHIMVTVKELPGHSYNWRYLLENQTEWVEEFGEQIAYPDPDDRPEFNDDEADWH
jgi:hypothetical protein